MKNKKDAYTENLRRGVYTQESIHGLAYWERRESIENKPFEYTLSVKKEQTEKEKRRKTPAIVRIDSEQNNQET